MRLKKEIKRIQLQLAQLPKGNLYIKRTTQSTKWHIYHDKKTTYLPKSNQTTAEKLAYKKYLTLLLNDLLFNQHSLQLYLDHQDSNSPKATTLLSPSSQYYNLLVSYLKPESVLQQEWQNTPYEKSNLYPEQLIHTTPSGNRVRSKSEVLIDSTLFFNKISYRYEAAIFLDDHTFYPDFTIFLPNKNKLYYWEHFGMMDNPQYAEHTYQKLEFYQKHGIIPSLNLITTFETKDSPLTLDTVEYIINHYFL